MIREKDLDALQLYSTHALDGEVYSARKKFPSSAFLMTALVEEVGELARAFLQRRTGDIPGSIRAEALQVACVAMRIYEEGDPIYKQVTDEQAKV